MSYREKITSDQAEQILNNHFSSLVNIRLRFSSEYDGPITIYTFEKGAKLEIVYQLKCLGKGIERVCRASSELVPVTLEDVVKKLPDVDKEAIKEYILENYEV